MSNAGKWDPNNYSTNASFVFSKKNTTPLLDLLRLKAGDHILDLGCGSGELTLREFSTGVGGDGSVLGVDSSDKMIAAAVKLLEGSESTLQGNTRFKVADGHKLKEQLEGEERVDGGFDKVVSNAALHWMKENPGQVFKEVYGVLKSGGVFAAEQGGYLNTLGVRSALHLVGKKYGIPDNADPWWFPTPTACQGLLEAAGFRVDSIELVPRPTQLNETGLKGWLLNFTQSWLQHLKSEEEKEKFVEDVAEILKVDMVDEKGLWTIMYVRLRFRAVK